MNEAGSREEILDTSGEELKQNGQEDDVVERTVLDAVTAHPAIAPPATLDRAIAALKGFVDAGGTAEQVQAARALREAAVEQRASFPRAASVALLLADALTFTSAERVSPVSLDAVRPAVGLLTEPFIPQARERELFESLLANGWQVTAFLEASFVEAATQAQA